MSNQVALHALTQRGDEVFLHAAGAHPLLRAGRRGGALASCSCAASTRRTGRSTPTLMEEYVHARRRRALRADAARLPREHAQPLRRRWSGRSRRSGRARLLRPARPAAAPRRRAHLERRRRQRACRWPRSRRRATRSASASRRGSARRWARSCSATRDFIAARAARAQAVSAAACARRASSPPAGLYALEHNIERLADDHRRVPRAGRAAGARPGPRRRPRQGADEHGLRRHARQRARRPPSSSTAARRRRRPGARRGRRDRCASSTHLDVDDADVEEAAAIVARVVERLRSASPVCGRHGARRAAPDRSRRTSGRARARPSGPPAPVAAPRSGGDSPPAGSGLPYFALWRRPSSP